MKPLTLFITLLLCWLTTVCLEKIFIRKWKEEVTNRKSAAEILAADFFVLRGATFWYCKMSVFVI